MDWGNLFTGIGAGFAGLGGGLLVRKTAKEANKTAVEANAGLLYSGLSTVQTAELIRLSTQVREMAEEREQERREREQEREASRTRNREHMSWDRIIVRTLRGALPDEDFPDPPPLDT